jgi:hypothetical protein
MVSSVALVCKQWERIYKALCIDHLTIPNTLAKEPRVVHYYKSKDKPMTKHTYIKHNGNKKELFYLDLILAKNDNLLSLESFAYYLGTVFKGKRLYLHSFNREIEQSIRKYYKDNGIRYFNESSLLNYLLLVASI